MPLRRLSPLSRRQREAALSTSETDRIMQLLTDFWHSIRQPEARLPDRRAVRPRRDIVSLVPYLILMELTGSDLVFRLVGTGHRNRMSLDLTGRRYGEFIAPERIEKGIVRSQAIFDAGCAARILVREIYEGERLEDVVISVFPLTDGGSGNPYFLLHAGPTLAMNDLLEVEGPFLSQPFLGFEFVDLGAGLPPAALRAKYEAPFSAVPVL